MNKFPLFDRDLSWLSFNYRVLCEAKSNEVPLLERLRFLAIYSSNLDEFFRVRVASLRRLSQIKKKKIEEKLGFDPEVTLGVIHEKIENQLHEYGATLRDVLRELESYEVFVHMNSSRSEHLEELRHYFMTHILAYLQPQELKEKPFIKNKALYLVTTIKVEVGSRNHILNIPSDKLPRFYSVKDESGTHFYFLDDIIRWNLDIVFPGKEIQECISIKLNKDADLQIDDEFSGNLVEKIEKQVKKRDLGIPTRMLVDSSISETLLHSVYEFCDVSASDISMGGRYHNLNDFFQISVKKEGLEYEKLAPIRSSGIKSAKTVFDAIEERDQILHFPYQSYEYILQFFNEAAIHPEVTEIYVTFYRMAKESRIGEALLSAARNGKKVHVFMEVKARFDEENNLKWAERFKEAGVDLRYSMPGLKVHAKVALVRRESADKEINYGFFGTGNLNESTAKIYCDHGLLSRHPEMTNELYQVFQYLIDQKEPEAFKHLIVSQFGAIDTFKELIDREIKAVEEGRQGHVIVKVNNLEEPKLIRKLYKAAEAGVKVEVIARSICCLVPGTNGIEVSRIVDRYLEHARMFYFHNDGNPEIYLGSSDWMKRNLRRRIEVSFPIYDSKIKKELIQILKLQQRDNTKRVLLSSEIENIEVAKNETEPVNAQLGTYSLIQKANSY